MLYVGVFLVDPIESSDEIRKLTIRNCWASPGNVTSGDLQVEKFDMIERPGCSAHPRISVIENGQSTQARFQSLAFAFAGFDEVYLFCDIQICFGDCQPVSSEKFLHLN